MCPCWNPARRRWRPITLPKAAVRIPSSTWACISRFGSRSPPTGRAASRRSISRSRSAWAMLTLPSTRCWSRWPKRCGNPSAPASPPTSNAISSVFARYDAAEAAQGAAGESLFACGNVEVGQCAFDGIGGSGDGLRESRVRMNRQADVGRVAAVLDGERQLADELAGVGADDAGAEQAARLRIEEELGHSLVTSERERPAARRPGEGALLDRNALGLRLGLGEARPGHFRVRI